ncbi:hypothetical protein HMPREF0204_14645 [Chryseobacterium gleum ATCC 35910]|uniref:Uncharacterized protein n=1 Tax=Chryseobacterium gleum ATCC 35910 TaxID=525257 RepID=A0ABN0ARA8_CHRGE|nr:hypothetical protein HMPREF0204_14645 [Chryseobacterium gleum ATCC 35910]
MIKSSENQQQKKLFIYNMTTNVNFPSTKDNSTHKKRLLKLSSPFFHII